MTLNGVYSLRVLRVLCSSCFAENLFTTALPPDVRRWLCLAVTCFFRFGLCPGLGCALPHWTKSMLNGSQARGQRPNQGRSPERNPYVTARRSHRLTSRGKAITQEGILLVTARKGHAESWLNWALNLITNQIFIITIYEYNRAFKPGHVRSGRIQI